MSVAARDRENSFLLRRPRFVASSLLVVLCCLGCSCEEDVTQPNIVLRRFLQAAADGDTDTVFGLLTPDIRGKLRTLANLATAQSGGRQRYRPNDLLATTLTPRGRTFSIKVVSVKNQRAQLQATAPKRPAETWHLRRIDGRWCVELPARALKPARPATLPKTSTTSRTSTDAGTKTD